jgi:hypothetical protein
MQNVPEGGRGACRCMGRGHASGMGSCAGGLTRRPASQQPQPRREARSFGIYGWGGPCCLHACETDAWLACACAQGREGKVIAVYRRKWVIHIERITREKTNGEGGCCQGQPGARTRDPACEAMQRCTHPRCPPRAGGRTAVAHSSNSGWPALLIPAHGACLCQIPSAGQLSAVAARLEQPSGVLDRSAGRDAAMREHLTRNCPLCACTTAGATVQVGVDPSKCMITKLKLDKDRKKILERKSKASADKGKGKFTESEVAMANVD